MAGHDRPIVSEPVVGIIANPSSGKDIRRLVALGLSVSNNDKVNIVRRVFAGVEAMGVGRVVYMPDTWGIGGRAAMFAPKGMSVEPLPMVCLQVPSDSEEAARRMAAMGVSAIVTLGGDGTNRMVARGCQDIPLVPISTGTNNVFPAMVEGTLAGMAAGAVASGAATDASRDPVAIRQVPVLRIAVGDATPDLALIDAVISTQGWVGARAVWRAEDIDRIVLSRIVPAGIGMASFGPALFPESIGLGNGADIVLDRNAARRVRVPLAPGMMAEAGIAGARLLQPGATVELSGGPCTIAVDGEREIEILDPGASIRITLDPNGPRVVEIEGAIGQAARAAARVASA